MKLNYAQAAYLAQSQVQAERARQDMKWGEQNHTPEGWLPILVEELGELAEAINETRFDNGPEQRLKGGARNIVKEATHCAAVAQAIVENMYRNHESEMGQIID